MKPQIVTQYGRGGSWLYGSIDITSGDAYWLILPQLNAANMQIFLDAFSAAHPDSFNIILLDNASAHTAQRLIIPDNVALLFQPAHCPELNPAERVWEDLRAKLAGIRFGNLDLLEEELLVHLDRYDPNTLQSLTAYPYLTTAYHAACT